MMTVEGYQNFVEEMILTEGDNRLAENTLGLVGEAGEVAEKVKKYFRGDDIDPATIRKELGDVAFYLAALCNYFDFDLLDVLEENRDKLTSRMQRGVLRGQGDDR